MALISRLSRPPQNPPVTTTFHEAIQHFIRPPNQNAKPALPIFKKRGKKQNIKVEKPKYELSKESALPPEQESSPRRFDGSTMKLQFKSAGLYYEVKLAEMLSKGKAKEERDKPSTPGKYNEAPDAYRTSICCQLLSDISKINLPFTNVLSTIHHELEQAIYSNYVTPSNSTTVFEQVPYFELVNNLENKNSNIIKEKEELRVILTQKQANIESVKRQVEELKLEITKHREAETDLQHNLSSALGALEKSNKEVEKLRDQLAKSRSEVFRAREVQRDLEECEAKYENLMAKHVSIVHELQHYQSNLEVARKEAADGVPKKEMAAAKAQIKDLQQKVLKAQLVTEQMGTMTPRPQWALLRGGSCYTMSTAAQAAEICKLNDMLLENVTSLRVECATAQVALAEAKQSKKPGRAGVSSPSKPVSSEPLRPNST